MNKLYSILSLLFCGLLNAQTIDIATFATGFNAPVNIKNAGDSRLFIVERAGLIQIVNSDGSRNSTPFLDINSIVSNSGGERGLLGLAFHPNYASNGYFYVNYINNSGDTVISRFSRSTTNPELANSTTELQLLTYDQPFINHNGGDMAFGSDGYLYISSGDGGSAGDPGDRAQSLTNLLGKILRIDVDGNSNGNYGIPADNPFVGNSAAMDEIWAYGLRNPWKFSFDRSTDELWIADVGQNSIEEINMVPSTEAAVNYGWRCYEGNSPFNTSNCPPNSTLKFPIAQYSHTGNGPFKCSITGGYRYRGTAQSSLVGLYFFADYCSDEIGYLEQSGNDYNMAFSPAFTGNGWTSFGEDSDGELFIAGIDSGTIYRVVDSNLSVDESDLFSVKIYPNPVLDEFTIEASNSTVVVESVTVYNIQGKSLLTYSRFEDSMINISTESLSGGIYFIEITNNEGNSIFKKIIKK